MFLQSAFVKLCLFIAACRILEHGSSVDALSCLRGSVSGFLEAVVIVADDAVDGAVDAAKEVVEAVCDRVEGVTGEELALVGVNN
ncbi:hypothetical protein WICPIJ_004658 [Wickerhamomyces pijperi]|uniref:Secreted protein n=1 Tax=Wickerhamomyces pijperi TaxID=599730 RepID=A0A9P8Q5I9_WICPI|nr:hypothetical protein WICPIJ_004658 [Wickerhamomyces pijperi]